jgi:hypothetical protein
MRATVRIRNPPMHDATLHRDGKAIEIEVRPLELWEGPIGGKARHHQRMCRDGLGVLTLATIQTA